MRLTKSLRAALLIATAALSGESFNPPTVYRGVNMILRGAIDNPYFEVSGGEKNLAENYDLATAPTLQVETLTVTVAAAVNGNLTVTVTSAWMAGSPLAVSVAVLAADTAVQVAGKIRTALNADTRITSIYTVGGAGAAVVLTDTQYRANDASLAVNVTNAGGTGVALDNSANTTAGVAGFQLTGTVTLVASNPAVVGVGTLFLSQLHIGQLLLVDTEILAVKSITSDLSFTSFRAPTTNAGGKTAYRLPQLFEIDRKRGVLLTGNAIKFELGHIITAGSGELFINGAALSGQSLTASERPRIAIYRPATTDYVARDLGFSAAPPQPTVAIIAGGTKRMVPGNKHSFMVSYWAGTPEGTNGFSDPCEPVKLDTGGSVIKIVNATDRFEMDLTTSLVGMPANAKGFIIWGSLAGKKQVTIQGATTSTTSPNETNYENGPWYEVSKVLAADLIAGDLYRFEYLDEDVGRVATGDNDRPPDCEFVAKAENKPVYISGLGDARIGKTSGTNPGPSCIPSKFSNPDAAPTDWKASGRDKIIGWFEGVGRWFLMTASSLDFFFSTSLLGQEFRGTQNIELPIAWRPYWRTGAANRYSITIIDDTLYGRSGGKLFTSIGNGDENVKKYDFGAVVSDLVQAWNDGYVYAVEDPTTSQVLFIYSAARKNASGYWESDMLPYSLLYNAFLPMRRLSSTTQDMVISGVAVIDNKMEFLCGGRVAGGTFQTRTYRYGEDDPTLTSMPWYIVWQPTDDGLETGSKRIHMVRPSGEFTSATVQIHGAKPGNVINVANMETGTSPLISKTISNTTAITRYLEQPMKCQNLAVYAVRIGGTANPSVSKDRLDELVIELSTHGKNR